MRQMKTALTIAGSDSGGGAGIQADIKTMTANGVFAMSAITSLTAQNTMGVQAILDVPPEFLAKQLDSVFSDIFPDAVKIGMASSGALIRTISEKLRSYGAKNIVVDPVMVATSGSTLIKSDALSSLCNELFPIASLITPNIPEAEIISGISIKDEKDMQISAEIIGKKYGCAVLLKGGHHTCDANDLLYEGGKFIWFFGQKIDNPNTHGTGCTLSSAISANLAKGYPLHNAIENAKAYLTGALKAKLNLGHGSGPLNHAYLTEKSGS